jgi:hypothetical protein
MEPAVARVVFEHRNEGALLRLSLSRETVEELLLTGHLDSRESAEGVSFMENAGIELRYGDEVVELVRLEIDVTDPQ